MLLDLRHFNVRNADRDCALCRIFETERLDVVEHVRRLRKAVYTDTPVNNNAELLLRCQLRKFQIKRLVRIAPVHKAQILRNVLVKDELSNGCVNNLVLFNAVNLFIHTHFNARVKRHDSVFVRHHRLVHVGKDLALALIAVFYQRQVVAAQYHILCRHSNRLAVLRF